MTKCVAFNITLRGILQVLSLHCLFWSPVPKLLFCNKLKTGNKLEKTQKYHTYICSLFCLFTCSICAWLWLQSEFILKYHWKNVHIIHINLNTIFYTYLEDGPTKTVYIRYMKTQTHTQCSRNWVLIGGWQYCEKRKVGVNSKCGVQSMM